MLAYRVHPSLLVGVELPPVPVVIGSEGRSAPGATRIGSAIVRPLADLDAWWATARTAASLGAGIVWFQGAVEGQHASCDACTIAAAAIDRVPDVRLGVVSSVPSERHPAVLAREVTALDVVSCGRAAVRLRWVPPDRSSGLLQSSEQFAEAVAVCDAVLREESPVFEGRHYHVAGAVNLPPPVQSGGLPLFADAPAGPAAVAATDDARGIGALRMMLQAASVVVCSDDPADVAAWRAVIEEAGAIAQVASSDHRAPALVCKTTLHEPAAPSVGGVSAADGMAARLRAARDAGADGVIVRIPPSRRMDLTSDLGTTGPAPLLSSDLERALSARLAPWVR